VKVPLKLICADFSLNAAVLPALASDANVGCGFGKTF
jgi:hypothetical protein